MVFYAISAFFSGLVVGSVASSIGLPRLDLLVEGEGDFWPLSILVGVFLPLLVALAAAIGNRVVAFAVNPGLTTHRIRWFYDGCACVGFAIGFCLIFLWGILSDPITPGRTNPPSYRDVAATAWDASQWFVYLAPPIVHILAAVGGLVMIVVGRGGLRELAGAVTEMVRRRQQGVGPGGSRLKGTITIAEPAPQAPAWTRLVAEVSAPEGTRAVEAIVPGTERGWLPGAKAVVYVSNHSPYDPHQTLIDARRFIRAKGFFASACPPASWPATPGARPAR